MTTIGFCLIFFLLGVFLTVMQPYVCVHEWGKWERVKGLTVVIRDEWGGKTEKDFNRFERTCKNCGIVQTRKKRTN